MQKRASVVLIAVLAAVAVAAPAYSKFPPRTAGTGPRGIAAGSDGNVWFTNHSANQIGRVTTAGSIVEFPIPTAASYPYAISAGPDGNVWFTETEAHQIGRITPAGAITEFPVATAVSFGITAGPDGNLWFTELSGQIGRITPSGTVTEFPAFAGPERITAGSDGNLWFTETSGRIGRITPSGAVTQFQPPTAGSRLRDITAGPDGNLWFTEELTEESGFVVLIDIPQVGRITPAGVVTEFPLSAPLSRPQDITPGPDGNLWFTHGNQIGRIAPTGSVTHFSFSTAAGRFPYAITAGPDNNIWFTEFDGNQIGRVTPSGAITEFPLVCFGDCDDDGRVLVDELIELVDIALGNLAPEQCAAFDTAGSSQLTIDILINSVRAALDGCPMAAAASSATPNLHRHLAEPDSSADCGERSDHRMGTP